MSDYSKLLADGAMEVTQYVESHRNELSEEATQWERLVEEMKNAANISDVDSIESAIRAIARMIVDGFPLNVDFAPSFSRALTKMQNQARRQRAEKKL